MNLKPVINMTDMKLLHSEMVRINQNLSGEGERVRNSRGDLINPLDEISALAGNQQKVWLLANELYFRYEEFGDKTDGDLLLNFKRFLGKVQLIVFQGQCLGDGNYSKLLNLTSVLAYNTLTLRREWLIETNYWGIDELGMTLVELENAIRPNNEVQDVGRVNTQN